MFIGSFKLLKATQDAMHNKNLVQLDHQFNWNMFTLNIFLKKPPTCKIVCVFFPFPLKNLNPFNPQWIFANKVKEIFLPHGCLELRVFFASFNNYWFNPKCQNYNLIFFINASHIIFLNQSLDHFIFSLPPNINF